MNADELLAQEYLLKEDIGEVSWEPFGNEPPDFLVAGKTGVEVRRLNKHFFGGEKPSGLSTTSVPFWQATDDVCRSFSKTPNEPTFWITPRFRRPTPKIRQYKSELKKALQTFNPSTEETRWVFPVIDNVEIEINYFGPVKDLDHNRFVIASIDDKDGWGWLGPEFERNLNFCIQEKSRKTLKFQDRCETWWLLLVDYIALGFDSREALRIPRVCPSKPPFSKVLIIHPNNGRVLLEY